MARYRTTLPPPVLHAGALDELQAFVAVAQAGSFTAAAARLGKDGSTVSRRIAALESRLGVRLVERTTRRVALTQSGAAYLARVTTVFDELASATADLSASSEQPHGVLRITAPLSYGRLWLAPLLPRFLQQHPQLRLDVHYSDRLVDVVAEGFDAAVRIGQLADSSLVARRLGGIKRSLVASRAYLQRHGTPQRPEELRQHRCLQFSSAPAAAPWLLRQPTQRVKLALQPALVADDAESLLTAAAGGAGIAAVTDWLLERHPLRRHLVPVLPDWELGEAGAIYLVTPGTRFLPAKTKAFIALAAQALRR
ncbi:MAG: LysR family transcriptional regulator [Aquincola sp.]|uniref:LysR family transcriptional regulator n=1 Tax=uncultured Aquincola sp. TaxID=886556 RepID=UPI0032B1CCF9|nr:LysR family transcriptional regulator [Aquincola sp.]|tara:strand:+ start:1571 stop:2500 length:930 start_codon:yes stop_codon:yes gene_type:complete